MGTIVKNPIGVEDVNFKTSGTTRQTFTRADSTSRILTLNQIDAGDLQFRTVALSVDDLVDGGYDVEIKPKSVHGGANNTTGHVVPDVADDVLTLNAAAQTLTNKTLTSPVLTTPQINDTSSDHQYVFAVSELTADRTVTLPLLAGNDEFVFKDFAQTLTNKTLTTPTIADASNIVSASETVEGVVERSTDAEAITLADTTRYLSAANLAAINGGLLTKVIDIGDWDIPTNQFVNVAHGLTLSNIRSVEAFLRDDGNTSLRNLIYSNAVTGAKLPSGSISTDATNVQLVALTNANGGHFDNTNYDSTSFNRGWVIIQYVP